MCLLLLPGKYFCLPSVQGSHPSSLVLPKVLRAVHLDGIGVRRSCCTRSPVEVRQDHTSAQANSSAWVQLAFILSLLKVELCLFCVCCMSIGLGVFPLNAGLTNCMQHRQLHCKRWALGERLCRSPNVAPQFPFCPLQESLFTL